MRYIMRRKGKEREEETPVTATYFNAASSSLSSLIWALSSLCVDVRGKG